ncbi:hypothetical protein ACE6H2_010918 [Prunus campanulata]
MKNSITQPNQPNPSTKKKKFNPTPVIFPSFVGYLQHQRHAFFDDELVTPFIISDQRHQRSCHICEAPLQTKCRVHDLFPYQTQHGLVGGDPRENQVLVVAVVEGCGDAEEPRHFADGFLEQMPDLAERDGGDNDEDALHEVIGEGLLRLIDAARGALAELVAGGGGQRASPSWI